MVSGDYPITMLDIQINFLEDILHSKKSIQEAINALKIARNIIINIKKKEVKTDDNE